MMILGIMAAAVLFLVIGGSLYSRFIARNLGEDASRKTPALTKADGKDFVATPTPIVFAHHFASIAGAGPIIGPVIAIVYGWAPALLWVLIGGVFIGGVHDYLATYMATREGGQSVATVTRRLLGKDAFVAMTFFLIVMLALVCATFLNLSATALTSMLPFARLALPRDQTLFRVVGDQVVIGGIASMSVIIITAAAPFVGWLYIKKKLAVWKCSLLAIVICAVSIATGVYRPVAFPEKVWFLGLELTSQHIWMLILSAYVLVAAGAPVWIFLQSRDFINVHILYAGMGSLLLTLAVAGIRGQGVEGALPAWNVSEGTKALGVFWPTLFIMIACGAVSGFHSLCAGGTTCKQLRSEPAARRVGYYAMLLESFLAVCVIGVLMIGAAKAGYLADVHPKLVGLTTKDNAVLGFAMAVGNAVKLAFGVPVAVGALAGMVLLEGFLVTTLDTAVRLTRYLIEEIWRTFFGKYDVLAAPVTAKEDPEAWATGEPVPAGAEGIPVAPSDAALEAPPPFPTATSGAFRALLSLLRQYWFNSGLAVALRLVFALTGGATALWGIFATSNQLLAALVLALGAMWLLKRQRTFWFALLPAVAMLATTGASLYLLFLKYSAEKTFNGTLLVADVTLAVITAYLLFAGVRELVRHRSVRTPAV